MCTKLKGQPFNYNGLVTVNPPFKLRDKKTCCSTLYNICPSASAYAIKNYTQHTIAQVRLQQLRQQRGQDAIGQ